MSQTSFLYHARMAIALVGLTAGALPALANNATLDPEGARASLEPTAVVEEAIEPAAPKRRRFYSSVGIGFDFSRGEYGSSEMTNTLATPAALKLEWEPVAFRLSVPFLLINGSDGVIATTDGPTSAGGSILGKSYRAGVGDVTTSVTYTYYPTRRWVPLVDLRVKVKIPTADADLGTQKTDTTLQFELTERFGPLSVFSGFGYRFKGGQRYDDVLLASVGLNYRATRVVSAGFAFDWRQASIEGVPDSKEISPNLMFRLSKHARFGPYGVVGFSDASPDWGIGAMSTYRF